MEHCSAKAILEVARAEHGQRSQRKSGEWEELKGQQKMLRKHQFLNYPAGHAHTGYLPHLMIFFVWVFLVGCFLVVLVLGVLFVCF